jgi:hypothetical protein
LGAPRTAVKMIWKRHKARALGMLLMKELRRLRDCMRAVRLSLRQLEKRWRDLQLYGLQSEYLH